MHVNVHKLSTLDPMVWWKRHENDLPHWSKTCKMVLLVQPSSAAAERVFPIEQFY